jgi:biotin carboxylase
MGQVLAVGFAADVFASLDAPPGSVVVVEEPELFDRRKVGEQLGRFPCVAGVLTAQYIASNAYWDVLRATPSGHWDAVLPVVEYAVPAAAELAAAFKLPGATPDAAACFRDKRVLRAAAEAAGIRQPGWAAIADENDVRRFVSEAGPDVVLKPSDRAASLGVRLLGPGGDLTAAWAATRDAGADPLLPARPLPRGFLAEQRLTGPEYSVEALVAAGDVVFASVTGKHVFTGPSPVERGHDVPAVDAAECTEELVAATVSLQRATGFGTGVLHAEWIITAGGPALVECAARFPGDKIATLLEAAYGLRLGRELLWLLRGGRPDGLPRRAARAAAVRFAIAEPGRVCAVEGVMRAREVPGVIDVVTVPVGHQVAPLRSSFDRVGYVITSSATPAAAAASAEHAVALVHVHTEPAPAT